MRVIYLFLCVFFIFLKSSSRASDGHMKTLIKSSLITLKAGSILHLSWWLGNRHFFGPRPPVLQLTFQLFFSYCRTKFTSFKKVRGKRPHATLSHHKCVPAVRTHGAIKLLWLEVVVFCRALCRGFTSQPSIMSRQYTSAGKHVHTTSADIQFT